MIAGIGIDMVSVERIGSKILKENGFREAVFSEAEIEYCEKTADKMQHYAARFSAKEAFLKATGKGLLLGVDVVKNIEVHSDESGKPMIRLSGQLEELKVKAQWTSVHVSLSHEGDNAIAIVIIEK
jgi:holo-[acyl-carrier protein] synthase